MSVLYKFPRPFKNVFLLLWNLDWIILTKTLSDYVLLYLKDQGIVLEVILP